MTSDLIKDCYIEHGAMPKVTDATRQDVIDCLRASWSVWDNFTRACTKHAIGGFVSTATKSMHEALEKMTNEQLAVLLYDIWDNGDLKVTSTVRQ